MPEIPVVNLGELGLGSGPRDPSEEEWQRVSSEIKAAFTDIGFVYLTNHGIPQATIDELFSVAGQFFSLDEGTKRKYRRGVQEIQGYTAPDQERLSEVKGVHELRESYDVHNPDGIFPDKEISSLRPVVRSLFDKCRSLTYRILTAMAIALDLERSYFVKRHQRLAGDDNSSCMRILNYPAPPHDPGDDNTTTRCGAHTDYGTVTLLFQDLSGGLEVKERGGSWVSAMPIPGTILVNVGDILQFWTADHFRATEHRVLLKGSTKKARQSVVFFVHPDGDVVVAPYDGSQKYTPLVAKEHTKKRFTETYNF